MLEDFKTAGQRAVKAGQWTAAPKQVLDTSKTYTATIDTSMGAIEIALRSDLAPKTVNNFVFLAVNGFYSNVKFHRVIKGFMIQTGDPTGTGSGGPGYRFEDEPVITAYKSGTLAMANAGPNTNGSQFFIISGPDGVGLPPQYSLFGNVVRGLDVVKSIESVGSRSGAPSEPVIIESVTITEAD